MSDTVSVGLSLREWISKTQSPSIGSIVHTLAQASIECAAALRTSEVKVKGTANNFGDEVLSVDLICDHLIADNLKRNQNVAAFASEEVPKLQLTGASADTGFTVAFDPLDGSSIIGSNFAVGSIFGVWKGSHLIGQTVADQHCAAITVYGPRTTFFVATKGDEKTKGVAQFLLNHNSVSESKLVGIHTIKPVAKVFAPGNLRSANQLPWYRDILKSHSKSNTTLRYTGGMVPDVAQIFVKGSGVFMTPRTPAHKVKLRVCFECGPIAFLVEKAGGKSTCGAGSFMDWKIAAIDERAAVAVGSSKTIEEYQQAASQCEHQTEYQKNKRSKL